MLGLSLRQLTLFVGVATAVWLFTSAEAKTETIVFAKDHLALLLLFGVETVFVAWLLQWRRRSALLVMLLASYFLSGWAAEGLPCVLPLRSGGLHYASVLTPVAAVVGVRFWQTMRSIDGWVGTFKE